MTMTNASLVERAQNGKVRDDDPAAEAGETPVHRRVQAQDPGGIPEPDRPRGQGGAAAP